MNASYFFSLWGRNIKGYIVKGYTKAHQDTFLWQWMGHTALLLTVIVPVVVPLIKTIFDCCTREYTRDEELLSSISKSIDNMTEKDTEEFIEQFIAEVEPELSEQYRYDNHLYPRSSSSTILFQQLFAQKQTKSSQIQSIKMDIDKSRREKHIQYALDEHGTTNPNMYKDEYIEKYQLNELHQKELDSWYQNEMKNLNQKRPKQNFQPSKSSLASYMNDEKNNGKKLFQLIVGFFSRKYSTHTINSVSESVSLLTHTKNI